MEKTLPLTNADFVHLHNHTHYSLLDGLTKVPALVERTNELGMKSVAITDHGTLSGAIELYTEATAKGIKPIIGMETYIAPRKHTDKDASKDKNYFHLILLAMNNQGYQNLMKLSTIANLDGYYYKPRIDHELLEKYNEGLIVLSGCAGSELGELLKENNYSAAKDVAKWYKSVFGDRYYLEIQDHGHPKHPKVWDGQTAINKQLLDLGKELDIDCVLTSDAHYLTADDQEAHEILLCVQTGAFLSDEKRMTLAGFDLFVATPEEVIARWGDEHPELIKNSGLIAGRCNLQLDLGKILIPKFEVPKGETEKSYLKKQVYRGLAWRYAGLSESDAAKTSTESLAKKLGNEVIERVEYELAVIDKMGFSAYFLIIADFVVWGKSQGIVFGPGRGSAAGSIVSYSLRITDLDPLAYGLLFERFLNPERISMPDIDIDIQDSRRDEVINYCVEKYGTNRVANIVTFGRMAARNAVRDVARVLQVPYAEADRLAKMIPPPVQGRHIPLSVSVKENQDLRREYESNETAKKVFDLAFKLEGTIRSHGVHAAGVVIAPDEIVKFVPLEMAQKGVIATQYSMKPIDQIGLLKIDFLGLSNLTIIKNTLRIVKKVQGKDIDISKLPLDDPKTFDLLQRADTTGVFQFESSGMKRYLKELKPTVFDDIIAMGALYRPGPLTAGLTQKFISRKNGREEVEYEHRAMKAALEPTYGVIVYQEQVMQISRDLCGFSGGQADTLRKAMGKKDREVMKKLKNEFFEGAIKTSGADEKFLEKFWHDLEGFADYAFNKSHAACYGMISYWTAYLKAHYPDAFMAALMTSDYDDIDRLAIEISECQHMGLEVLPPDVNESFVEFATVPGASSIRFGMNAIKNVGTAAVEEILRARQDGGRFVSIEDFLGRVNGRTVNKKSLESLIKTGAFDAFGDRGLLLANLDNLASLSSRLQKAREFGQTDLFGGSVGDKEPPTTFNFKLQDDATLLATPAQRLGWERELLGLYLSEHPLTEFSTYLAYKAIPIASIKDASPDTNLTIGGAIGEIREITTKNGQKMAFVKLADLTGEVELVVFPKVYEKNESALVRDTVVLVTGKFSSRDKNGNGDDLKILADKIEQIDAEKAKKYKPRAKQANQSPESSKKPIASNKGEKLYIRIDDAEATDLLTALKSVIDKNKGETTVVLVVGAESSKQAIKLPSGVNLESQILDQLSEIVGKAKVKLH